MDGANGHDKRGTGRFGLPNWSALKLFHGRVQQLVSLPEFIAFAVGHATTRPTCDSSRRDGEINTRGAAGVHDIKYICQKDTSDAYAWRGQVTTPAGTGVANRIAYWTGAETLGSDADFTWNPSTGALQVRATTDPATLDRYSADSFGAGVLLRKSRNATPGSHTIVQSGDDLGSIQFSGSNGTGFDRAAQIVAEVDGTPGSSNDMPGRLRFDTTPDGSATPAEAMRITQDKNVLGRGAIRSDSATAGVGYATGAGGTVTQNTSKSTGVTLNTVCGVITMNNATLNSGNEVSFVVTNSAVAATDVPVVAVASGASAADNYQVTVGAVAAGSFTIVVGNHSASNLSEALVINFAIIKGVSS